MTTGLSFSAGKATGLREIACRPVGWQTNARGSLFVDDLRHKEGAKIACGKAHFQALAVGENPARYVVARSVDDVLSEAAKG